LNDTVAWQGTFTPTGPTFSPTPRATVTKDWRIKDGPLAAKLAAPQSRQRPGQARHWARVPQENGNHEQNTLFSPPEERFTFALWSRSVAAG
jgi:hypothetical protein